MKKEKEGGTPKEGTLEEIKPVEINVEIIKTKIGKTRIRKHWTFKVFNIDDIPRKYFQLNEVKIRKEISEGVRKIPGLEIFQEEQIAIE